MSTNIPNRWRSSGFLHHPKADMSCFPDQQGADAHTDYGSLVILSQDSVGGLEIRNQESEWISVEPFPSAFVCNVGHIMEIWTNGLDSSTWHRLINNGMVRYSQMLFYDPNFDSMVAPLECCVSEDRSAAYEPIKMGRYFEETSDKAFVYRSYEIVERVRLSFGPASFHVVCGLPSDQDLHSD
ncbi:MAG: 2OG-Fe(II) oxygenase family protein [SAR324 cluster bacterium]|nr:2OG-Fe(II) oxygenase family protein [SAR324 cluster bacterium]